MKHHFLHRQSARETGIGMMVGPPLIAASLIAFAWFLTGWSFITWIFVAFLVPLAGVFFVVGLRRVIFGGHWGCLIDDERITWTFPHRMRRKDQQIPLRDITAFVVQVDTLADDPRFSYFIETAADRFEMTVECFGQPARLGRALLAAHPAIKLLWQKDGQRAAWEPDNVPWAISR